MQPLETTDTGGRGIARVKYTHDAMIDQILMNPKTSQNELALYFGYSVGWVSSIMNSDAFQARLAARKDETVTPQIREKLEDRFAVLADQSLTILQNKLQATQSPDLAVKALELSTKALSLGARQENANTINNTYVVALPPKATNEEAWSQDAVLAARRAQNAAKGITDVTPKVVDA